MTKDAQAGNHLLDSTAGHQDYSKPAMVSSRSKELVSSSLNTTQGSKCNLLDESGIGVDSTTPTTDYEDSVDQQAEGKSVSELRYNQMLKEAYSAAKTPTVHQSVSSTYIPSKYPFASEPTPIYQNAPITKGIPIRTIMHPPPRYPYPQRLANETPKSQSMDALGSRYSSGISVDSSGGSSSKQGRYDAPLLDTAKRPLSFTQAIQLHDSLQRLNSGPPGSSSPARNTCITKSGATPSKDGMMTPNEIRV